MTSYFVTQGETYRKLSSQRQDRRYSYVIVPLAYETAKKREILLQGQNRDSLDGYIRTCVYVHV